MSNKKNYRAMYNKQPDATIPEVTSITKVEEETIEEVEPIIEAVETVVEVVEIVEEPKREFAVGTVIDCAKLNVRKAPKATADVVCVIPAQSEVQVCLIHEYDAWYHVYTAAGQEGYCMKQFIEIE